jgi:hypothetical protein
LSVASIKIRRADLHRQTGIAASATMRRAAAWLYSRDPALHRRSGFFVASIRIFKLRGQPFAKP